MTVPNQRDPDFVQVVRNVRNGLDDLKRTAIARWGRVPHVAADPAAPPDGAIWIRSDLGDLRYRANGTTIGTGTWTAPPLLNSWTNFGGSNPPAQYRKIGDRIEIRGVVTGGSVGAFAVFTLPAGFRPAYDYITATASNSLFGVLAVRTATGNLEVNGGSNVWASLAMSFSILA